jgi:hypothetical protein
MTASGVGREGGEEALRLRRSPWHAEARHEGGLAKAGFFTEPKTSVSQSSEWLILLRMASISAKATT